MRSIERDVVLPHPPERVWRALTEVVQRLADAHDDARADEPELSDGV